MKKTLATILIAIATSTTTTALRAETTLLNVSYDVARELYKDINPLFIASWKAKTGETLTINQSHGGSSKQAGSVINGLEADVVTMNQASDIDILVERGGLVRSDWRRAFPNDAAPYTSVTVFLVRKGNPQNIKDWSDLTRDGVSVIIPNPKTSGNGRYTYLAAYGYALRNTKSEDRAKEFVKKLFANVPVLDGGGRGATTTFTQRGIGDVLVTFENEFSLIEQEVGQSQFEVVYPSLTVEAPAPVAVVDKVVAKKGTQKQAQAYLDFLYSAPAQEVIARHHFRPRDAAVAKKFASSFPSVKTFTVEEQFGSWAKVQKEHFADGAVYDQIVGKK